MLMYAVPMFSMYDVILFGLCLTAGAITVYVIAKIHYWYSIWQRKRIYNKALLAADRQVAVRSNFPFFLAGASMIGLIVILSLLASCTDYVYQRGCNPPFGDLYKCK